jgi:hypothetical protein
MKNFFTLLLLQVGFLYGNAQITFVFQPGPGAGNDLMITNNPAYPLPVSASDEFAAIAWTCGGTPCDIRSIIMFDLTSIPAGTVIQNATLSLYANPQQTNGNPALGPTYGSANAGNLLPITSSWNISSLTYSNQPSTTLVNSTLIPQSITNYQDYLNMDVTAAVQAMVDNPATNYGWMMKLDNEVFYNSLIFCSSEHADFSKRPRLEIIISSSCQAFNPGPAAGDDIIMGSWIPFQNPDSVSAEFGAVAWTCQGNPCNVHSLLRFDLSSIPANATVQSASLTLYANPQQINGNPGLGPTYGSANEVEMLRVTSPWSSSTVHYYNEPATTNVDQVIIPQSSSAYNDYYNLDVTTPVQAMVSSPSTNYGWLMKVVMEVYYNGMIFCSSNYTDSLKRPLLTVCYTVTGIDEANAINTYLSQDPSGNFITIMMDHSPGKINIDIIDAGGKIVKQLATLNNEKIPVAELASGLYFVKVISDQWSGSLKFFKRE